MWKTPASILQEHCLIERLPSPNYREYKSAHSSICDVKIGSISATGYGRNKKQAKHDCAQKVLEIIDEKFQQSNNEHFDEIRTDSSGLNLPRLDYISYLGKFADVNHTGLPYYRDVRIDKFGEYTVCCEFLGVKTAGAHFNKKTAKQLAAQAMYERLYAIVTNQSRPPQRRPRPRVQSRNMMTHGNSG